MRSLSDEQIDLIADDIRIRGVFTQSLQEDLLDHICCFIEEQDDERPFEEIYRQALDAFGQSGLQGVQDETLYLINQPYQRAMKKFAYITGALASIMLLFGAFFKIMHWPGANSLLILGTVTLSMFFIPYFFYVNLQEQSEKKSKVIAAAGLITALFLCAATLFKMMHWPGTIVMMFGFGFSFLIFLPLYIMNGIRNPLTKVSSISNGFLFAAVGCFVLLMSFQSPSKAVTDSLTVIHQNEEALLSQLRNKLITDSASTATIGAVDQFIASTNKALADFDSHYEKLSVGNGVGASPQDLAALNAGIKTATDAFNAAMSEGVKGWTPIAVTELQPSLNGSLRFQVVQLQCSICTEALGY
jgi:hypothetical protein